MLFDLSGKRKRVVQVSYALLAAIFLVGFIGIGIGSGNSTGGILDAVGLGGGGSGGSLDSQYDDQIDSANQQLAANPKDSAALLKLSKYEYFKAKQGVTQDQTTGEISVSEDAHTELGKSVDAWEKYLKVNKGQPSPGVAAQIVQAYYFLNDFGGAAEAQRIVASEPAQLGRLRAARLLPLLVVDIPEGDKAAKQGRGGGAEGAAEPDQTAARPDPQAGREGEKAAGEGAEERATADHSRRQPPPEPVRRRRAPRPERARQAAVTMPTAGPLAQLVEQETLNLKAEGSSPSRPMA